MSVLSSIKVQFSNLFFPQKTIDITSGGTYPGSALSNFASHAFVFDDVECASMEGLLQAFKFESPDEQIIVCGFTGITAKKYGKKKGAIWKNTQTLYWKEQSYTRDSPEYQQLLDCAYKALAKNKSFRIALKKTRRHILVHTIGKKDPRDTVLTEQEFCSRLEKLRSQI